MAPVVAIQIGKLGEYFPPNYGIGGELDLSYRNIVAMLSLGLTFGSVGTTIIYEDEDWRGFFVGRIDFSLGYRIQPSRNIGFVPHIGVGYLGIGRVVFGEAGDGSSISSPTASLGMILEVFIDSGRLGFGVTYRRLLRAVEDRFEGSELTFFFSIGAALPF
jgi:hypothetical protein